MVRFLPPISPQKRDVI